MIGLVFEMPQDPPHQKRLKIWLTAVILLALIMGPGPGVYLVNPDASQQEPAVSWFGVPILYWWAVFWAGVLASAVAVAYCKLWKQDAE